MSKEQGQMITTRKIERKDLPAIAVIHKESYPPDHFSARFTLKMLEKYYDELSKNSRFSFVAIDENGEIIGFIVANFENLFKTSRKLFIRNNLFAIINVFLRNPIFLKERFVSNLDMGFSKENFKSKAKMMVISIATSPRHQRKSVAKILLDVFEQELKLANISLYGLCVKHNNTPAINFYKKRGLTIEAQDILTIYFIKSIKTGDSKDDHQEIDAQLMVRRKETSIYSFFNRSDLPAMEELQSRMLGLLARYDINNLGSIKILEVGCGGGFWLREFIRWGARPENLTGIDISEERIALARELCPQNLTLLCGDAARLEFADGTFDLVLPPIVFSSSLEVATRHQVASEMVRVLKPDGLILWYDFHAHDPWNPNGRVVKKKEIHDLFPGCRVELQKIPLGAPLSRVVANPSMLMSKMAWWRTNYLGAIKRGYGKIKGMKNLLVITSCPPNSLPSQGEIIADLLSRSGITTSILSRSRFSWGRLLDIAFNGYPAVARHDNILVNVYGHRAFLYEALALLYGRLWKKRVVALIHGGWMGQFIDRWPRVSKYALSRADLVLTPHEFLKNELSSRGINVDGMIPNFVELEKYCFRMRSNLAPRFLYLRGLHPIYNPEMALRAFSLIQRRYPNAMLTMAGNPYNNSGQYRLLVKELSLHNVNFVGLVPKTHIPVLANSHDLYIQTNRIENFPVTVIEMWASGVPVVGTEVGGMSYLVRNYEDGILVKSEDYQAMAEACLELLHNPRLVENLSLNGRKRAENLGWEQVEPLWREALLLNN